MIPPLDQIARDALLPRLPGFRMVSPSPLVPTGEPNVLLHREPIEDVFVGILLVAKDEREFFASYESMPLFAPTDSILSQAVGMQRDGFLRRFFRDRRWIVDGQRDAEVIALLTTYIVEEGIPILERRGSLASFADELMENEYERESDPEGNEQAAYARILAGRDDLAMGILEELIRMEGRGLPGATELSEDEMNVLKERARRMVRYLREDRQAAVDQLRRWRLARIERLGLPAAP